MTTLHLRESIGRTARRRDLRLTLAALACFALPPTPKAFGVSPAPDGGYPGNNTAEGSSALLNLTSGISNTAVGFQVLYLNTTGNYNTAIGAKTMQGDKGAQNTGTGYNALIINHTGSYNTANGANALYGDPHSDGGSDNTGIGQGALYVFLGAIENTAVGRSALASNDRGAQNTAVGFKTAGHRSPQNVIALGHEAPGTFYTIKIGTPGGADVYTTRIGDVQTKTFIAGISGIPVTGSPVVVTGFGRLGTSTSSARFKKRIKPMDKASEAILGLNPVSFEYKSDPTGTRQFGLIAEEVAKVNPDLVTRDRNGEIYSVRYEAVNAMLLNEFLKQHKALLEEQRKVQEQQATMAQLKSTVAQQRKDLEQKVARLTTRLDEQVSQLEKVSAELTAATPSGRGVEIARFATAGIRGGRQVPQMASNNQ